MPQKNYQNLFLENCQLRRQLIQILKICHIFGEKKERTIPKKEFLEKIMAAAEPGKSHPRKKKVVVVVDGVEI